MIKEINFSKRAVERVNQLIAKKPLGTFFRIAVKGGGCSGFKYDFSFDNNLDETDLKYENIVVDKSSLQLLKGSQVDFTEELIGESHYYRLTVPPGIWFGFQGFTSAPSLLLNISDIIHDPEEVDSQKLDVFPYQWT